MKETVEELLKNNWIASALTIIVSIILYNIFYRLVVRTRKSKGYKEKLDNRKKTYFRLISNMLKYAFIVFTVIIVLQINGVNVSSMLAGVGIAGVVIGLALQDALKDIIMGANIITDDFFSVGDVVRYNGIDGKVIGFGLKTTKIQDVLSEDIITISNRNITEIQKLSNLLFVNIPAPYEIKVVEIEEIIDKIIMEAKKNEIVNECRYIGLGEFADSSVIYKLEVTCEPEIKARVKRHVLRCIKMVFENNNIDIPYQQICIHNVENND